MITVGICDDEKYIVDILKTKIQICFSEYEVQTEIFKFYSGKELLDCEKKLDLLFLDIDMPEIDGIEAGKLFRNKNEDSKIIMLTARSDRMREAFFLEAYRFITKPFEDAELKEAIESLMRRKIGCQKILLYEKRKVVEIFQYQIMYIQTYDSYTEFIVGQRILRSERSLKELETELDGRLFIRIDRKYIVNFRNIDYDDKGTVSIAGKKIKVSRRRIREFEERYREFDIKYR